MKIEKFFFMPINIANSYNDPKGCYMVLVMSRREKNDLVLMLTRDCERFLSNELSNFFFKNPFMRNLLLLVIEILS
jgi:hypothetical protein